MLLDKKALVVVVFSERTIGCLKLTNKTPHYMKKRLRSGKTVVKNEGRFDFSEYFNLIKLLCFYWLSCV